MIGATNIVIPFFGVIIAGFTYLLIEYFRGGSEEEFCEYNELNKIPKDKAQKPGPSKPINNKLTIEITIVPDKRGRGFIAYANNVPGFSVVRGETIEELADNIVSYLRDILNSKHTNEK